MLCLRQAQSSLQKKQVYNIINTIKTFENIITGSVCPLIHILIFLQRVFFRVPPKPHLSVYGSPPSPALLQPAKYQDLSPPRTKIWNCSQSLSFNMSQSYTHLRTIPCRYETQCNGNVILNATNSMTFCNNLT